MCVNISKLIKLEQYKEISNFFLFQRMQTIKLYIHTNYTHQLISNIILI